MKDHERSRDGRVDPLGHEGERRAHPRSEESESVFESYLFADRKEAVHEEWYAFHRQSTSRGEEADG